MSGSPERAQRPRVSKRQHCMAPRLSPLEAVSCVQSNALPPHQSHYSVGKKRSTLCEYSSYASPCFSCITASSFLAL
jgi:hypothetical protein